MIKILKEHIGFHYLSTRINTAQKSAFPRSWNIMESSKRPRKYHLSNQLFVSKKDRIFHLWKVQNKNFSVIGKYRISINFFDSRRDRVSHLAFCQSISFCLFLFFFENWKIINYSHFLKHRASFVYIKEISSLIWIFP